MRRRNAEDMSNSKIDHDVTVDLLRKNKMFIQPLNPLNYELFNTLGSRENDVVVDRLLEVEQLVLAKCLIENILN